MKTEPYSLAAERDAPSGKLARIGFFVPKYSNNFPAETARGNVMIPLTYWHYRTDGPYTIGDLKRFKRQKLDSDWLDLL